MPPIPRADMAQRRLDFETGTMSPMIPVATAVLIGLFVIGLLYQLVGVVL